MANRVGYYSSGDVAEGISSITEVLSSDNFIFVITDLESILPTLSGKRIGAGYTLASSETADSSNASTSTFSTSQFTDLAIKCQTATIPGFSNNIVQVNVHGFQQNVRGKKDFQRTLSITYIEDVKLNTSNLFRAWAETIKGTFTGMGLNTYKRNAVLYVFPPNKAAATTATVGTTAKCPAAATFAYYGLFPQDVAELALSGDGTNTALINVTFAYDIVGSSLGNTFVPSNTITADNQYANYNKGRLKVNVTTGAPEIGAVGTEIGLMT